MFADTLGRGKASAMIYSILESAKTNGHHPHQHLTMLLSELPNAKIAEDLERLLSWNLSADDVTDQFALYPRP